MSERFSLPALSFGSSTCNHQGSHSRTGCSHAITGSVLKKLHFSFGYAPHALWQGTVKVPDSRDLIVNVGCWDPAHVGLRLVHRSPGPSRKLLNCFSMCPFIPSQRMLSLSAHRRFDSKGYVGF